MNPAVARIDELRQQLPWEETAPGVWGLNDEMWITQRGDGFDFEVIEDTHPVLSIDGFASLEDALLAGSVVWWLTYLLSNAQSLPLPNGKNPWMDAEEAAEVLGIHVVTLRRLIRTGELKLPVLKVGRRLKVLRKALDP